MFLCFYYYYYYYLWFMMILDVSWQLRMVLKWFWIFIDVSAGNWMGIVGSCWFMMVLSMFLRVPRSLRLGLDLTILVCLFVCLLVCILSPPKRLHDSIIYKLGSIFEDRADNKSWWWLKIASWFFLFVPFSSHFFLFLPVSSSFFCFFFRFFPFLPGSSLFCVLPFLSVSSWIFCFFPFKFFLSFIFVFSCFCFFS